MSGRSRITQEELICMWEGASEGEERQRITFQFMIQAEQALIPLFFTIVKRCRSCLLDKSIGEKCLATIQGLFVRVYVHVGNWIHPRRYIADKSGRLFFDA